MRGEIYHLKAAGRNNWPKLAEVFEKVETARAEGLAITADIYPYTAGATVRKEGAWPGAEKKIDLELAS